MYYRVEKSALPPAPPRSNIFIMAIELLVIYEILGLKVKSEILRDQETENLDGQTQRSIFIRSSCESTRWGTRSQDYSYTCPAHWAGFEKSFPKARLEAAGVVAKQELGLVSDVPSIGGMGIKATGPLGKQFNGLASVDLSVSATRLWPWVVEALGLKPSGSVHIERATDGSWRTIPLFSGKIIFDQ